MADYQSYKKIQGDEAIIANSVGPGQVTGISTGIRRRDFYFSCCHFTGCSGGCCRQWTVPQGTTTIQFELVGGGGSGGPGRCCTGGYYPGGSGSYATKTLYAHKNDFTPGSSQYTICAAGTSRCSCCGCCNGRRGCGFCGCESYVQGSGLSNFCAAGGSYGHHKCNGGCYQCKFSAYCRFCNNECAASACGRDFFFCGMTGSATENQYCNTDRYGYANHVPGPWGAGFGHGRAKCGTGNVRGCCYGHSLFPGGGGYTAGTEGGPQCWGDWGANGLVVVTYWS